MNDPDYLDNETDPNIQGATSLPKLILEPYNGIPVELRHTLTVVVNRDSMHNISKLHHKTGLYRYVISALLHKLTQTLHEHSFISADGQSQYDPDRFTQFITECRIVWPGHRTNNGAVEYDAKYCVGGIPPCESGTPVGSPQPPPVPAPSETHPPHDRPGTKGVSGTSASKPPIGPNNAGDLWKGEDKRTVSGKRTGKGKKG